jgi:hypothetical protein
VVTLPLPPQAEQPILPWAAQAPQASWPLPWHLLHWTLTLSTLPTPSSRTSPLPSQCEQENAPAPLQEAHASEPAPAQVAQLEVTTTVPFAPQVWQPTAPEPWQVAHTGGGAGGG